MKKYIKPIMESESFVANEYISTCYTVTCGTCGAWEEGYDSLAGTVITKDVTIWGKEYYSGTISEYEYKNPGSTGSGAPCTTFNASDKIDINDVVSLGWNGLQINWDLAWPFIIQLIYGSNHESVTVHKDLSVVENWTHTTNHPNASV